MRPRAREIACSVVCLAALQCNLDPMAGRYDLPLGGSAVVRAPGVAATRLALPPRVVVTVAAEPGDDWYAVTFLGCTVLARRARGIAHFEDARCALDVSGRRLQMVDVDGQIDERSDLGLNLTVTAVGEAGAQGSPVHEVRLVAPAGP